MTSEKFIQRSEILGTQVITRTRGKRLGVVSQLWVDIDKREVVALGIRDNILAVTGLPKFMFLDQVKKIGDVILVEDDTVLEDEIDIEAYSSLINSEVITETGEPLGRVRGFKFNTEDGTVVSLVIASLGWPQIPEQLISTYELPIEEIVSSGPNRLIVFEGSEERLRQLSVGLLERVGLGQPPWERDEEVGYYPPTISPGNQLGTGIPINAEPVRRPVAAPKTVSATQNNWDEDDWERPATVSRQARQAMPEPTYQKDEEDNWGDAENYEAYDEQYDERDYSSRKASGKENKAGYPYHQEVDEDAWADEEDAPYQPPRVNIPEKSKAHQYEEETGSY
jgi:sporulation protein YlmC with PRC-barrel domain